MSSSTGIGNGIAVIAQDLRYAWRTLRRAPGFTVMTVLTLALGTGAVTIMFSVIYSVLMDPLPYKEFNRSVVFGMQGTSNAGGWKGRGFVSLEEFRAFRDRNNSFEELIGSQERSFLYDDGRSTRVLRGAIVTANTLDYLGVPPHIGRGFTAEDGRPGAAPVFVMNDRLWQREFGADPAIIGTTFQLNGESRMLVGIMPRRFNAYNADIWLAEEANLPGTLRPMGRLKPGVSVTAAAADLDRIAHQLASEKRFSNAPESFVIVARTYLDSLLGNFRSTLFALLGAVLLLLLIACTNVAHLMLARATTREREMAMRASIGATRERLLRQLAVESLTLAAAASVAGFMLAYAGIALVAALIPPGAIPAETEIHMSVPVLLAALALTMLTTLGCGLVPALYLSGGDLRARLAGKASGGKRHSRFRAALVVTEIALSVVLLVGAGLLMRSFLGLTRVDLGFDPKNVLYIRPWFPANYDSAEKKNGFTAALLERMQALPGVTSVAESMLVPPLTHDWSDTIIPGKPHAERWETRFEVCSAGYFQTLGLRLLDGALFTDADVSARRHVVVVNQAFVRQFLPGENPLGKSVRFQVLDRPFLDAPHNTYFEIVGVVSDHRTWGGEWQTVPQAFLPYSVQGFSFRTFLARTTSDPALVLTSAREAIWAIDPRVGVSASGTIESSLRDFYRDPKFDLVTLGAFAALGLALVAIGVFSVMAYTVSLRTHEIGVRMALGARRADVLQMILGRGFVLVGAGSLLGILGASTASRVLATRLVGISPLDIVTFAAVAVLILVVGGAACLLPARRATKVDPMLALRAD